MSDEAKKEKAAPPAIRVDENGLLAPADSNQLWQVACWMLRANLVPRDFDSPEKVMIALQYAREVGLSPMKGIQRIAIVNGRPALWREAPLALVQASGKLTGFREWFEDLDGNKLRGPALEAAIGNGSFIAFCWCQREGNIEAEGFFSKQDAMRAGLWGKNVWANYPLDMARYKARSRALDSVFADILTGVNTRENLDEFGPEKPIEVDSSVVEVSPRDNRAKLEALSAPEQTPLDAAWAEAEKHDPEEEAAEREDEIDRQYQKELDAMEADESFSTDPEH